jgi:aminoglycoside phosphotransferase (APT) family kinase protein
LNYLMQLPNGNKVCHGDYHTDNIIMMDGEAKVLDWMTATSVNPCGDVARTLIMIRYSYLPSDMPKATKLFIQTARKLFARFYLNSYMKLTNTSAKSIDKWLLPVMAARLVEGVPEPEKQFLLRKIRHNLCTLAY